MADIVIDAPPGGFGAILADPPWAFETFAGPAVPTQGDQPYKTMSNEAIAALPVRDLAARNCVLFLWVTWPCLLAGIDTIRAWGFSYKTCAFCWVKADGAQMQMFEEFPVQIGTGYWTRANSEVCLLATRGKPKRLYADVRQAIIEPRRQHSRKPDCVHLRIERLCTGPYLELFARERRAGWASWGNEVDKFNGGFWNAGRTVAGTDYQASAGNVEVGRIFGDGNRGGG